MLRPRLKVEKSCQWCKHHRKKCDGRRPHCGPCLRRGYLCSWTNTAITKLLESNSSPNASVPLQDCLQPDTLDSTHQPSDSRLPTPGQVSPGPSRADIEITPAIERHCDSFRNIYGSAQKLLASTTDFGNRFDEHVIISGVLHGWGWVKSRFVLDSQWPYMFAVDDQLCKVGHDHASRMAALWFCRMKWKVRYPRLRDHLSIRAYLLTTVSRSSPLSLTA